MGRVGRPQDWQRCKIMREFWDVMDEDKFMTIKEIMFASGRRSNGGPQYTVMMNLLRASGQVEFRNRKTPGRYGKEYRKVRATFYNTHPDPRVDYLHWDELTSVVKEQALERYKDSYPWLSMDDWEYPVTRKEVTRLSKVERVLRLTIEEAERKREAWRSQFAGVLLQ